MRSTRHDVLVFVRTEAMCGRYALRLPAGELRQRVEEQVGQRVGAWEDENDYNGPERGFNIPPRTLNPVLRIRGGGGASSQELGGNKVEGGADRTVESSNAKSLRIQNMQWGLVPHWMKRLPDSANTLKTINARDDTIMEGGSMWKSVRGRKRCIVLAEGFYEWLKKGAERIPHHVKRKDGKLMCMAGMWDGVTLEGEKEHLYTYTIVTTNSNKQLNFLHDRMPVILDSAEDAQLWLDTSSQEWTKDVANLLKPFEGELECFAVPKEVGKVGQQSSDFLRPVSERKGNLSSFFAKQTAKSTERSTKLDSRDDRAKQESTMPEPKLSKRDRVDEYGKEGQATKKAKKADNSEDEILVLNPDEGDEVAQWTASSPQRGKKPPKPKYKPSANALKAIVLQISDDSDIGDDATSGSNQPVAAQESVQEQNEDDALGERNAKITAFYSKAGQ